MTRNEYEARIDAKNDALSEIYAAARDDPKVAKAYHDDTGRPGWSEKFKTEIGRVVTTALRDPRHAAHHFNPSRLTEAIAEDYCLDMGKGL